MKKLPMRRAILLIMLVTFLLMVMLSLASQATADWSDIPWDKRLHFKGGVIISGMGYVASRW